MGRTPCCEKNGLKKGPWTPEEDQKLIDYIQKHGHGTWRTLPKNAGLARCGKSCRLRWTNYLRPDIKRGRFSFEEEETIIQLHSILGNTWSAIAARLPGRTDNEIKNYWNTHIRKRLLRSGIDPVTHRPRLDLLNLSSLLNTLFFNQPPPLDALNLLDIKPHLNTEFLRIVSNLLQSQSQESQPTTLQTIPQQLPSPLPDNEVQFSTANQWQYNEASSCYLRENLVNTNNDQRHKEMDQTKSSLLYVASNVQFPNDQSLCSDLESVLSTPVSSESLNNYSVIINNSSDDEKESFHSSFLDYQIPEFFDISEFI